MASPTITIITPSYQQGQFLERTLQSVLSQGVPDLEYLVMDGGSRDESVSILKRYASSLSWWSEQDQGQAHAVNKGLVRASADIIGWLNSDDVYFPGALQTVLQFFARHPEVDVVYGNADHIDLQDKVIAPYPVEPWDLKRLTQTCILSQPAVFFRKRVLSMAGLLDESLHFCMDYEFWLRLGLQGATFAYLPVVLAGSRLHAATKTLSAPAAAHREAVMMLHQKLGYAPARWLLNWAVCEVKSEPVVSRWRYLLKVWGRAGKLGIQVNGWWRGLVGMFVLPWDMVLLRCALQR